MSETPSQLHVGSPASGRKRFCLPEDVQTQTIAVLGIRGSGKSHTACVIVEELAALQRQFVVIDPTDVWWGLKSSVTGKSAGFPVVVIGGPHGDIPLAAGDGAVIADFLVEHGASVVLSLRHLRKGDQRHFVTDFAEQLYHRKGEVSHRTPLAVVIDECDAFIPQRVGGAEARMVGAIEDLVRRGRAAGLGVVLISQRAASINKDVLTQIELLVAHRHTSPQDRKALDLWIEAHDTAGRRETFMQSLASLPRGEAWFWSPGWLDVFDRVHVRDRKTFDSSATPKGGGSIEAPKKQADVDLDALKSKLQASIDKAKADDPKELRKRIADLERELATAQKQTGRSESDVKAMLGAALFERDEQWRSEVVSQLAARLIDQSEKLVDQVTWMENAANALMEKSCVTVIGPNNLPAPTKPQRRPDMVIIDDPPRTPQKRSPKITGSITAAGDGDLPASQQKILASLAWWASAGIMQPTRHQVAFTAGYTVNGHFNNSVGQLRTSGLIEYPPGSRLQLTPVGVAAAPGVAAPLTRAELIEKVREVLKAEPQRRVFDALVDAGGEISRAELAARCSYTVNGHFNNTVGKLNTLGVARYPSGGMVALGEMFDF